MLRRPDHRTDTAAAISGVDQRLRECLQVLRLALPPEKADVDELENNFRRLVDRAVVTLKRI